MTIISINEHLSHFARWLNTPRAGTMTCSTLEVSANQRASTFKGLLRNRQNGGVQSPHLISIVFIRLRDTKFDPTWLFLRQD